MICAQVMGYNSFPATLFGSSRIGVQEIGRLGLRYFRQILGTEDENTTPNPIV